MKDLVKLYNEKMYASSYGLCLQQNFLSKLCSADIKITPQTLRNWEISNLLTPPLRRGQSGGGMKVEYSNFSLAEAFAVYNLTNSFLTFELAETKVKSPKYSLLHVEMARRFFCKKKYTVPNFPKLPPITYSIHYIKMGMEENFSELPNFDYCIENAKFHLISPTNINYDAEELAKYLFFQSLYSTWFIAIIKGCKKFFPTLELC